MFKKTTIINTKKTNWVYIFAFSNALTRGGKKREFNLTNMKRYYSSWDLEVDAFVNHFVISGTSPRSGMKEMYRGSEWNWAKLVRTTLECTQCRFFTTSGSRLTREKPWQNTVHELQRSFPVSTRYNKTSLPVLVDEWHWIFNQDMQCWSPDPPLVHPILKPVVLYPTFLY